MKKLRRISEENATVCGMAIFLLLLLGASLTGLLLIYGIVQAMANILGVGP